MNMNDPLNEEQLSLAKSCAVLAGSMEHNGKLFPFNSLDSIWRIMNVFPLEDPANLIYRAYPIAGKDSVKRQDELKEYSQFFHKESKNISEVSAYVVEKVVEASESTGNKNLAEVTFRPVETSSATVSTIVPTGGSFINRVSSQRIIHTTGFRKALSAMVQEHGVGRDVLLVSPKGEGKNALAQEFAATLGYDTHLFAMYSDITSQDLLLRRSTDPVSGETKWEDSALLKAARNGDLCVLDGIEKLRPDVLTSLQSLMIDRDFPLVDGRRAVRSDCINLADPEAEKASVPIHRSFRVVALASLDTDSQKWMTPGLMSMLSTIHLPPPTDECLRAILKQSSTQVISEDIIDSLLIVRRILKGNVAEECGVAPLSTRNMIRAVRRLGDATKNDLYDVLGSIFLVDLLPPSQRLVLDSILKSAGIESAASRHDMEESTRTMEIILEEESARIGSVSIPRKQAKRPEMVPSPQAFDIPAHTKIIHNVLAEWKNGERSFLFLGNQGTGKNKITDRICEIGNWEREYIQLHRDSTIGQLTLTPQLEDGKIVWNDSPLIRAVRDGCVLVVDEADKAPVEVISVLKGLVEDGELLLADGRRISKHRENSPGIIPIHPDFSLWVLANRPGYPFHGNDLIREIGDCFSVRIISNPDLNSEMALLKSYAPGLDFDTIRAIASSFAELRKYSDNRDISYPYSTREAIAVVKHIERFPSDSLVSALHNVLDFDSYDEHTYALLGQVFQRHGIPVSDYPSWKEALTRSDVSLDGRAFTDLRIEYLNADGTSGDSPNPPGLSAPKFGKWDESNEPHVGGNQWAGGKLSSPKQ
jgi:MoxR-like ATPase